MILSSFKIVVIFNNTSADSVLISADVLLKMTTILKELRIAHRMDCSCNISTITILAYVFEYLAMKIAI